MSAEKQVVAVFDLDNTITFIDTLVPFIFFSKGYWFCLKALPRFLKPSLDYAFKCINNDQIKEKLMTYSFKNEPYHQLEQQGEAFATGLLPKLCRQKALDCIRKHQSLGHRCIIVSSTFRVYLEPWAKNMGIQEVICTALEVTKDGLITGRLEGKNCMGAEKANRLNALLGDRSQYILYAYGDSEGDKEMLEMADYPHYRVFSPGAKECQVQ